MHCAIPGPNPPKWTITRSHEPSGTPFAGNGYVTGVHTGIMLKEKAALNAKTQSIQTASPFGIVMPSVRDHDE